MGRNIDWTQPLSPEDREYAKQFPGLHGQMLEANEQQFGVQKDATDDATLDGDDDGVSYNDMTVAELLAECDRRNKDEGASIKPSSNKKADLVAALEKDDTDRPV